MKNTVIFCDHCGGVGVRGEVLFGSQSGYFLHTEHFGDTGFSDFSEDHFGHPAGLGDLGVGQVQHWPQQNLVVHY